MMPIGRRRISTQQRAIAFWAALAIAGAVGALPATPPGTPPADRAESERPVELYVAVVDGRGDSVEDLSADELRVVEDGRPQRITRFEPVTDLPLHLALVLDVSDAGSRVVQASRGASGFGPGAGFAFLRAANHAGFRRAGLRGTETQSALEQTLGELEGRTGQRAILIFSDGVQTNRRDAHALVEYARRSGLTLYTVGFGIPDGAQEARRLLRQLAVETGGRTLFVGGVDELELAYAAIVREMCSRYLVAFESDRPGGTGFRTVELELARQGLEVRAARGYYP